jgi:hypothetical protein
MGHVIGTVQTWWCVALLGMRLLCRKVIKASSIPCMYLPGIYGDNLETARLRTSSRVLLADPWASNFCPRLVALQVSGDCLVTCAFLPSCSACFQYQHATQKTRGDVRYHPARIYLFPGGSNLVQFPGHILASQRCPSSPRYRQLLHERGFRDAGFSAARYRGSPLGVSPTSSPFSTHAC